jgi:hypothetical protein
VKDDPQVATPVGYFFVENLPSKRLPILQRRKANHPGIDTTR